MSIIGSFTRRSMRGHRKWTVVTILGVVISTAMISAVSTFTSSFTDLMRREAIADNGNWHAAISNVKTSEVPTLRSASFVSSVSLSRSLGYALLPGAQNEDKPYLYLKQYDALSQQNYPISLLEGRMPKNGREIALPQHAETNGGVKIHLGETLTLRLGRRLLNGDDSAPLEQNTPYQGAVQKNADGSLTGEHLAVTGTETFTVVGIIARPAFEPRWAPGYTAVTCLDDAALGPNETVNAALLAKHPGHSLFGEVDSLARKVGADPAKDVTFNNDLLRYSGVFSADNLQWTLYGFMAVIIAIIMLASVSLIYNAFAISVSERTRQLGMLASVGATRAQKRRSVYLEGFYIGLIGIPVGVLCGVAGIGVTLAGIRPIMASFTNFSTEGLRLSVSPLSIAAAVLLAILTILVSAWRPARRASRIMPIDAIRQTPEIRLTAHAVRISRLSRRLFGFEGELALKNLKRSRKKYRATVVSLAVSLVLFLTASYYPAFMGAATNAAQDTQNYDMLATFSHRSAQTDRVFQNIAELGTVTQSAVTQINSQGVFVLDSAQTTGVFRQAAQSSKGSDGAYRPAAVLCSYGRAAFEAFAKSIGADPKAMEDPQKPAGILINASRDKINGVYISGESLAVRPGDSLRYEIPADAAGGSALQSAFTVGAVTDALPIGLERMPFSQQQLVVCDSVFDAFQARMPENMRTEQTVLFLNTNDSAKLEAQIDDMAVKPSVYNVAAEARRQHDVNLVFEIFIFGFIALISLICIANMFNTITTNVALRRREFAMLRSVGMTPKGFGRMIRYESVFYGLKALLWGLPISFGIGLLLNWIASSSVDGAFVFPWRYYLTAVVLLFVIVASTMLYASAKVKRENIVDALTNEDL